MEGFGFGLGAGGGPLEPIIDVGRELAGVEAALPFPSPLGLRPLDAATGGGARLGAAGAGGGGALSTSFKLFISLCSPS
jgi:hypothetical protein